MAIIRQILAFFFVFSIKCICAQQAKLILPIRHTEPLMYAVFSPDGQRVLTASQDKTAKIWDAETGNLLANFTGHQWFVYTAEFSRDGKQIVTASGDNTAKIWDARTGDLLVTLTGHTDRILAAHFSKDGKKIVTASTDSTAKMWEASTGKLLINFIGHKGKLLSVLFSPDEKKIVTAAWGDGSARIWDARTGDSLVSIKENNDIVNSAKFSPDARRVVTTSNDHVVKVWDALTGKLLVELKGHTGPVWMADYSKNGNRILTASGDSTAKLWDAQTGNLVFDLTGHKGNVPMAKFSPDEKSIVTVSEDRSIKIWDAQKKTLIKDIDDAHKGKVWTVRFDSTGNHFVTASQDKTAKVWETRTGKLITHLKGYTSGLFSVRVSNNGTRIISPSGDTTIKVWGINEGRFLYQLKGHTDSIRLAIFSPDGNQVASISKDKTARLWDAFSGDSLITLRNHSKGLTCVQFSPDGKLIATGSEDKTANIYAANGVLINQCTGHTGIISSVQFSHDSKKLVTASLDSTAKIWDVETGKLLFDLQGHKGQVSAAEFSPDDHKILTASRDETAKLWDASTGKMISDLNLHTDVVSSAKFSWDGRKIVTSSKDNTVKIWDTETGKLLKNLKDHSFNVRSAEFTRDDSRIISVARDNTAKIWDAETGKLLQDFTGNPGEVESGVLINHDSTMVTAAAKAAVSIWDAKHTQLLYTFFPVGGSDYLVVDKDGHFDGTDAAIKMLYYTCGTEVITLDQVKSPLWVPSLAEKIMKGEKIEEKKLSELDICDRVPEVQALDNSAGLYHFIIRPRKGGLGETILSVNDALVRIYQPEELVKTGNYYELKVNKNEVKKFFVSGKENRVKVKAFTAVDKIASRGAIVVNKADSSKDVKRNMFIIMIGVSNYRGDGMSLNYPAKDAEDMSKTITAAAKKMLKADGERVFVYNLFSANKLDLYPDKQAIKKAFEDIYTNATTNDYLLLFFAGHGTKDPVSKKFYLLTADATSFNNKTTLNKAGISMEELAEWMQLKNIKMTNKAMILDACNSGQAINEFIKNIDELKEAAGLNILCATAGNQSAYEMNKYKHGLLTYSLLGNIKENKAILRNGNLLDVRRWFSAATETAEELSRREQLGQSPRQYPVGTYQAGVVDNDITATIDLAVDNTLFAGSDFGNGISTDTLQLTKYVNGQLHDVAGRGSNAELSYLNGSNALEAWKLRGVYELNGDMVNVKVSLKQNKDALIQKTFTVNGTRFQLKELADDIVEQAKQWITANRTSTNL